jgi:hypothetical protein
MNKIPQLFVSFLICCVVLAAVLIFVNQNVFAENEQRQDVRIVATNTAVNTKVADTATVTPNRAIETRAQAEAELAVLEITIVAGQATETARIGQDGATSTAVMGLAGATETAMVYRTQIAPTNDAIALLIAQNQENAQMKKQQAETMMQVDAAWFLVWRTVLLAVLIGIGAWFLRLVKERMNAEDEIEEEDAEGQNLGRLEIKRNKNTINYYAIPCSDRKLIDIAHGVIEKKKGFTYEEWTPLENGFSRGQWRLIIAEMLDAGLIEYQNGNNDENGYKMTAPAGWGYFAKINDFYKPPTPPLTEDDPNEAPHDT